MGYAGGEGIEQAGESEGAVVVENALDGGHSREGTEIGRYVYY